MKKVSMRAFSALLMAFLIVIGLFIYVARYVKDGESWALFFDQATTGSEYTITDRNGVILAKMGGGEKSYAEDAATRVANYHVTGDYTGNVGTGALSSFKSELSGFNLITGIEERDDVTMTLTVDAELDRVAYEALNGRKGAVMMYNYKTGEVLCMVSSPSIDPLNPPETLPDGAYINRCISASFVPGSVFKLVTLTAAIENMPDLYHRSFSCAGSVDVKGVAINCTGTHGQQSIEQALSNSCNCAFAEIALELGPDIIADYAKKLGITESLDFDGIDTRAGNYSKDESLSAAMAWSGIGQSEDLVCPYAMMRLAGAYANGGKVVEPSMLGESSKTTQLMSSDTAEKVASMMNYTVVYHYGSGRFPGLNISAKTGTAEVGNGQASHGWFVGFLNDDAHPYAFVCLVENGGSGLGAAGTVMNTVLQAAVNR